MSDSTPAQKALLAVVGQHRRTHPTHGHHLVLLLAGYVKALERGYPDDVALAAAHILEYIPEILGVAKRLDAWATIVNQCEPHEAPNHGALWKG